MNRQEWFEDTQRRKEIKKQQLHDYLSSLYHDTCEDCKYYENEIAPHLGKTCKGTIKTNNICWAFWRIYRGKHGQNNH
ncbi:MAG TPA: hypothetical protein PK661_10575 [Syntrophorhabdaceae bacterium]|nr:hypothetical protein [Syntrophorhabdaceae bacterium]